ncbi:GMC oxidoreductase [Catenovulum agarivorans]|uniref:GMC oxidoreductase n=1 Tax=Catenovulum agarivorans TaxID=1172192 RepID=UPI000305BDD6|nr:GMC oxidoreductase [Catenovulum agarivorans]
MDNYYDFIIVGGGLSTIALLDSLKSNKNFRICVVESGLEYLSIPHQELNLEGDTNANYFPLASTRIRQFGGTLNHWSGVCARIPNRELSLWGDTGFTAYYSKAENLMGISSLEYKTQKIDSLGYVAEWMLANPMKPIEIGKELKQSLPNVTWYFGKTVTKIVHDNISVKGVEVSDLNGNVQSLQAAKIILAAGGIENPRLLMQSNFDNIEETPVGQFFCEHPHGELGFITPSKKGKDFIGKYFKSNAKGFSGIEVPNGDGSFSVGFFLTPHEHQMKYDKISVQFSRLKQLISTTGIDKTALLQAGEILKAPLETVKFLSERFRLRDVYTVKFMSAQSLSLGNKLSPSQRVDRLSKERINLEWSVDELDKRFITEACTNFANFIVEHGYGSVRLHDWLIGRDVEPHTFVGGFHHMCTTRKGKLNGVVNSNNETNFVRNLFVLGSSCFERPSYVNPSLTIAAMSYEFGQKIIDNTI